MLFFFPFIDASKSTGEKGGGSLEILLTSQHKYVHPSLHLTSFISQSSNTWLQGLSIQGCLSAPSFYPVLTIHFYCKQQLLVIKAGPFVLLFCKQSGLLVNMEMICRSVFHFHQTRCWCVFAFPLQSSDQELGKTYMTKV